MCGADLGATVSAGKATWEIVVERKEDTLSALAALSEGLAEVVEKTGPSVVQVNGRRRRPASGVVYTEGKVLTASHVVEREENITVVTHDGRALEARLVGRDPVNDLAVLE